MEVRAHLCVGGGGGLLVPWGQLTHRCDRSHKQQPVDTMWLSTSWVLGLLHLPGQWVRPCDWLSI